jgi:hypothetical protein
MSSFLATVCAVFSNDIFIYCIYLFLSDQKEIFRLVFPRTLFWFAEIFSNIMNIFKNISRDSHFFIARHKINPANFNLARLHQKNCGVISATK